MSQVIVQRVDEKGRVKIGGVYRNHAYMVIEKDDDIRIIIINEYSRRKQAEKKAAEIVSRVQTEVTLAGQPMDQETMDKLFKESVRKLQTASPQLLWGE